MGVGWGGRWVGVGGWINQYGGSAKRKKEMGKREGREGRKKEGRGGREERKARGRG